MHWGEKQSFHTFHSFFYFCNKIIHLKNDLCIYEPAICNYKSTMPFRCWSSIEKSDFSQGYEQVTPAASGTPKDKLYLGGKGEFTVH